MLTECITNQMKKKIQKCSNFRERSGMFWNKQKIKFQIILILFSGLWSFFYSNYSVFSMNFHDNSRKKSDIFFFDFHSFQNVSQLFFTKISKRLFSQSLSGLYGWCEWNECKKQFSVVKKLWKFIENWGDLSTKITISLK